MRRLALLRSLLAIFALLAVPALPVTAKDEPKTKEKEAPAGPHLRWAHSLSEAVAEARDRGTVVFATFHEDG